VLKVRIHTRLCHELFSIAIEAIFTHHRHFVYCGAWDGTGSKGDTPSGACGTLAPTDILITDFGLTEDIEDMAALRKDWPGLRMLCLLPVDASEQDIIQALQSRADGFVYQSTTRELLLRSVETLAQGQSFLQPEMTPVVLKELRTLHSPLRSPDGKVDLTEREHLLLQLSADGLSNQRISEVLYVHEKTVRNMWSSLFQKIGVADRTQAVLWAIRSGYAELR